MDRFFKECNVVKPYYYQALQVWEYIKPGIPLEIWLLGNFLEEKRGKSGELNNIHLSLSEEQAVVLVFEKNGEEFIIGELSKDDSKFITDILVQGWNGIFCAMICSKIDSLDEDKKLRVVIYIKNIDDVFGCDGGGLVHLESFIQRS